jgi:transposase
VLFVPDQHRHDVSWPKGVWGTPETFDGSITPPNQEAGRIVREVKVASEPDALLPVLTNPAYRFKRIGLEAGPLSQWLFGALAEAELPVVCVETRHMKAALKAQINKTDPQRCSRHCADDAGGTLSPGAC